MCRNWRFWLLAVAYCVPVGTYGAFGGIMDIDLNPTGISQVSSTAIQFYITTLMVTVEDGITHR